MARALELAASDEMAVDASLVTLDFALRHRLLQGVDAAAVAAVLLPPRAWPDG
jgi:hypothetical protein